MPVAACRMRCAHCRAVMQEAHTTQSHSQTDTEKHTPQSHRSIIKVKTLKVRYQSEVEFNFKSCAHYCTRELGRRKEQEGGPLSHSSLSPLSAHSLKLNAARTQRFRVKLNER